MSALRQFRMFLARSFQQFSMAHRLRSGGTHLALSLVVAVAAAALVFGIWYPAPYRSLSGGLHLFSILIVVDIMLGPLATVVVSRPDKPRSEWRVDVALIVCVQLAALAYGLWTMHQARPVYLAFEIDRMRVVHSVDVSPKLLARAPEGLQSLPFDGPGLIAVRPFASETEKAQMTIAAIQGLELGFRPDLWIPYETARADVLRAAKPVSELIARKPAMRAALIQALESAGQSDDAVLLYLPLHGRSEFWTVLLDPANARPVAYLPLDPY